MFFIEVWFSTKHLFKNVILLMKNEKFQVYQMNWT